MGRKRRLINNPKFTRKNSSHPILKSNTTADLPCPMWGEDWTVGPQRYIFMSEPVLSIVSKDLVNVLYNLSMW